MALKKNEPVRLDKTVYLFDDIKTTSVLKCIQSIQTIVDHNSTAENSADPIKLVVNSGGGDVYDGLALIGYIQSCPIQIDTYAYGGRVMSMALPIFLTGHIRRATKYTTFMYHASSWGIDYAKIAIHKQELNETARMDKLVNSVVLNNTKISKEKIAELDDSSKEWYISATEAKKLDIIHELI